jgi:hypothetical protein
MCALNFISNKCRTEHNVAFFKWRENFSIEAEQLVEKYSFKLLRSIEEDQNHLDNESKKILDQELLGADLNSNIEEEIKENIFDSSSRPNSARRSRASSINSRKSSRSKNKIERRPSRIIKNPIFVTQEKENPSDTIVILNELQKKDKNEIKEPDNAIGNN